MSIKDDDNDQLKTPTIYGLELPGFVVRRDSSIKKYFLEYLTSDGRKGCYYLGNARKITLCQALADGHEVLAMIQLGLNINMRIRFNKRLSYLPVGHPLVINGVPKRALWKKCSGKPEAPIVSLAA